MIMNKFYFLLSCLAIAQCSLTTAYGGRKFKHPSVIIQNTTKFEIQEVSFTDTATVLSFHFTGNPPKTVSFPGNAYLSDEQGCRHLILTGMRDRKDSLTIYADNNRTFTLSFDPLPQSTRVFDFMGGDLPNDPHIYGIHKKLPEMPVSEGLADKAELKKELLTNDTVCIRGQITVNGQADMRTFPVWIYARNQTKPLFPAILDHNYPIFVHVHPDGTFETRFVLSHPIWGEICYGGWTGDAIPFYARPGERLEITADKTTEKGWEVAYGGTASSHHTRLVQHAPVWTNSYFPPIPPMAEKETVASIIKQTTTRIRQLNNYITWKYALSSYETYLLERNADLYATAVWLDKTEDIGLEKFKAIPANDLANFIVPAFGTFISHANERHDIPTDQSLIGHALAIWRNASSQQSTDEAPDRFILPEGKGKEILDRLITPYHNRFLAFIAIRPWDDMDLITYMDNLIWDFQNDQDLKIIFISDQADSCRIIYPRPWKGALEKATYLELPTEEFHYVCELLRTFPGNPFAILLDENRNRLSLNLEPGNENHFRRAFREILTFSTKDDTAKEPRRQ